MAAIDEKAQAYPQMDPQPRARKTHLLGHLNRFPLECLGMFSVRNDVGFECQHGWLSDLFEAQDDLL